MGYMKIFFIGMSLLSVTLVQAGSGVGNGGVSVVCRDHNDKITSAELLDIYEGKVRYGKTYKDNLDADTKIELAKLKLIDYPKFLKDFTIELENVRSILQFVPEGNVLTPTDDAFPTISKKGCEFEQVANYTNDGDLLVSLEIYDSLNEVDKAALLVHETVYALFRKNGAKNSIQSRKLTAELLAEKPDQEAINQIIKSSWRANSVREDERLCGLEGNIEDRIKDCNKIVGNFALVTRAADYTYHEVYKDLDTGLIWSSPLHIKMNHHKAVQACNSILSRVGGISRINSGIIWGLPSLNEFLKAEQNGIKAVTPQLEYPFFWTSTSVWGNANAWLYDAYDGIKYGHYSKSERAAVRCVGKTVARK